MVKYKPLLEADYLISHKCCDVMKKKPAKQYEKTTNKRPIIATMTEESRLRETKWLQQGCNAFENKRQISQPMSFWTEQDVLHYIKNNNLPICSVYGDVVCDDEYEQISLLEENQANLKTTGCHRTGCIFCAYGCHLEKGESRFQMLKQSHPKQYDYCINGGEFVNGIWQPNKDGLGMGYVFDKLNELYGDNFIQYK